MAWVLSTIYSYYKTEKPEADIGLEDLANAFKRSEDPPAENLIQLYSSTWSLED